MARYSKILIPVDFSSHSRAALEQACELARNFDSELHVLHILDWPAAAAVTTEFRPQYYDEFLEHWARASRSLDELTTEGSSRLPAIRMVRSGLPVQEILKYAQEAGIDLIVLGTHGRTGVPRWVMGSVAEKVVRHAPCPVLIARPHARRGGAQ
jgi:nucleotide-binding universal stress UspA family protein